MFALPQLTAALVRSFNLRTEKHGDDDVTAMDLGMRVTGSSVLLDLLHSNLREQLYLPPDPKQASIPGESPPWTVLRCDAVPSVAVKHELVGRNVMLEPSSEIESELSKGDGLELTPCNVNKFHVTAHQGGTVDIDFRIQCANIDAATIGSAGAMLQQEVKLSMTHSEPAEDAAPAAQAKAPAGESATDLFAGKKLDDVPETPWPFPKTGEKLREGGLPSGPPPQSVTVEPSTRTARGREKTKAALASGAH